MRRLLTLLLALAFVVPAHAGVDPADAALALPIERSDPAANDVRIDVPPSVFAHLRHGTDDLRVVDAEGRELPCMVLSRDGSTSSARADLEPRLVSESSTPGRLALLFDLRVRAAPGLALELELRGPVDTPLHVSDTDDPRGGAWEEIPFVAAPSEVDGVVGRAAVPSGAGKRWVRVVVPTSAPSDVRLVRAAASVKRHRLYFRADHGTAPFTLLAGFETEPGAPDPARSVPLTGWSWGEPAGVPAPPWLELEPGLGAASEEPSPEEGRPFPGAELVATLLALALTIWAVLLRKEG